jgi:hypothetical protein
MGFDEGTRELTVIMADLVISPEWARALDQPAAAGQWIGSFELRLAAAPAPGVPLKTLGVAPRAGPRELDVLLGELYDLMSVGRLGTYPDGLNGLSAATTSCNYGYVDVPWRIGNMPLDPAHPTIGLALFREKDDRLEMLGKNWLKHGFLALANDQCDLGCVGGGGNYLAVGCSDTYSAGNNAARLYLGPREEFNPHTGGWEPCGSFFDGEPADCNRSYFGEAPDDVAHRLEVHDADLGDPDARYFYEGCYYVADDEYLPNNIGWRECTTTWDGSRWRFSTIGMPLQLEPNPNPVVFNWGDVHETKAVAPDDGLVILATKVTRPDSDWHYEYALYNRTSDRGVYSFAVPVGTANVSQVGFRDADRDAASDWTVTVADGMVTWSTDDHATDPDAPALFFQTLFNFWFDADRAPVPSSATAGIFKPGLGTTVFLDTQGPALASPGAPVRDAPAAIRLSSLEPNPFSHGTALRFALPRRGRVRLSVLDVTGRVVQVLTDDTAPPGRTVVRWDGRDSSGRPAANGVYFFPIDSDHGTRVTKGTLLR